ncbi:hypothetical protein C0991_006406 [Blastosporella zonata]|nr:hypothetical protein C0991_006406 [Blastosporella zonata]
MAPTQDSPAQPSWATVYHAPPAVKYPYVESEALGDLPGVCYALEMFLASHMVESEEYCHESDKAKERLYFTTGYGLIQCVKGLMSYADEDLLSAINCTKHGYNIASQHRKKAGFFGSLVGSGSTTAFIRTCSFWEVAVARLSLWEVGDEVPGEEIIRVEGKDKERVGGSAACWRVLEKEATWSKAIYSYGLAACLLEDWDTDTDTPEGRRKKDERMKEAQVLMARVPNVRQKIAGKSIPLEKYVARKARKFATQHNRLLLPALEVAYIFQAIAHAPRTIVARKMLPLVRAALGKLALYGEGTGIDGAEPPPSPVSAKSTKSFMSVLSKASERGGGRREAAYEGGAGEYWDDLCLARFLEGVCLRFIAYPDPDAVLDPDEVVDIPRAEAEAGAE